MKKLLGLIFNRWTLLAVLLAALGAVIWFEGPIVAVSGKAPLETENARWIAIGAVVGFTLLLVAWNRWRASRGNAAVVNQLVAAPVSAKETEGPDLAAVRERFERAVSTLRRARFGSGKLLAGWTARFGGRYLYELPWYLIIGAPGSGKTTALQNCGLKFPLADKVGDHAVRGVGGTRNCDWWFTDQAVLIDTAGRFTTQDSDRETDSSTWGGFLTMLAKARPRQPVNGVLVTVSVYDLLTRGADDRTRYAATVRARMQELQQHLGIRFPVYLLVTKCDLMAGFMNYFETLGRDQRAAPWGFTFPLQADEATPDLARLNSEFATLQQRLTDGLVDRLQAESDPRRRAAIYAFPSQFAGLLPVLQEFVDAVFSPSQFDSQPLLRGVYFISGTQEGTPIDRMLGAVARSYRLENAVLEPNQSSGKSFFLSRLLGEVVFAESGVAGTNLKWERRRTQLAVAGYALVALVTVGTLATWGVSYANNRRYVASVAERVEDVRQRVNATPNRNSPELLPVIPALEATRSLADPDVNQPVPRLLGFGLFQGRKLDSAANAAYDRMLVDAVQPRLALRVEEQLRQGGDAGESQYEALKIYLMLHDPNRLDPKAVKDHIERDWDARLSREITIDQRARLTRHLDALLAQGQVASPLPQDAALVATVRAQLASVSLPQRVYDRLRNRPASRDYPDFSIVRAASANAELVFARASGKPLTQGVPGLFTYAGYHSGFQNEVDRVTRELADEQGWVLGIDSANGPPALRGNQAALTDDVRRIYLTEYESLWESYIADIRVVPLTSLSISMQTARLLAANDSPLPLLVRALTHETTLAAPLGKPSAIDNARNVATGYISDKINSILPGQAGATGPSLETTLVDDHFVKLRQFSIAPDGGKAPVDDVVATLGELAVMLQAVKTAIDGGGVPTPSPLPNKLKAQAATTPQPVRAMLESLSDNSDRAGKAMVRENLSKLVQSEVGEFCNLAIARRYPIDPLATLDANQADFAQLFGPGGKMDKVMQTSLAPFVDTSARPNWRFRTVDGAALGNDVGTLPQFQRAAIVRDTFFPAGSATPSLRLDIKPIEMDTTIKEFVLDVDGQIVRYMHGPQIPTSVQWPGPRGSSQVRVQVTGSSGSNIGGMVTEGPWALFRMFDRIHIDPGATPDHFRATFEVDGRKASFDVTTSSVRSPFGLKELREFQCPSRL